MTPPNPSWPLTQVIHYTLVRGSSYQIGSHRASLSKLISGWPWLTPVWPLTPAIHNILPGALSTKFGNHRTFLSNLTSGWPQLTPARPLTPAMCYTLLRGSSYQVWWSYGIPKQFDLWLTQNDPCMTFDPSNALHSSQGFFLPSLVAIRHSYAIWHLIDLDDPCMTSDLSSVLHFG